MLRAESFFTVPGLRLYGFEISLGLPCCEAYGSWSLGLKEHGPGLGEQGCRLSYGVWASARVWAEASPWAVAHVIVVCSAHMSAHLPPRGTANLVRGGSGL